MYADFPLYDCFVVFVTLYLLGIATCIGVSRYVKRVRLWARNNASVMYP